MKREITHNGPILCSVNFYRKRNGAWPAWTLTDTTLFGNLSSVIVSDGFVVKPSMDKDDYTKQFSGGHALTIYGFGTAADGTPYWDCQNSWGTAWGQRGSIKIQRGVDAWNIESACISARVG